MSVASLFAYAYQGFGLGHLGFCSHVEECFARLGQAGRRVFVGDMCCMTEGSRQSRSRFAACGLSVLVE